MQTPNTPPTLIPNADKEIHFSKAISCLKEAQEELEKAWKGVPALAIPESGICAASDINNAIYNLKKTL